MFATLIGPSSSIPILTQASACVSRDLNRSSMRLDAVSLFLGPKMAGRKAACDHLRELPHEEQARLALERALAVQPDMTIRFASSSPMRFPERKVRTSQGGLTGGLNSQRTRRGVG